MDPIIDGLLKQLATLQQKVDKLIKPEVGRWMDWTPTVTQSGSVTITVNYARYIVTQSMVIGRARVTVTGSGTTNNAIVIGGIPAAVQPANAGATRDVIGTILILDAGTGNYQGALVATAAGSWNGVGHGLTSVFGVTPNFGLANTDQIGIQFAYERA